MKIQKYKTIENAKYVSKDIPITKKDIVIIEKKDDTHEFDIFESKEYVYEKPSNIGFSSALEALNNNNAELNLELKKIEKEINALDIKSIDLNSEKDINNTIKPFKKAIDISKELDEDIYSDLKFNIEKSIEDEKIFDDPYKTAIKLEKEDEKNESNKTQKSNERPLQKLIKKFKKS